MPELNFKGKEFFYNHHLTVPFRPLKMQADKGISEAGPDRNLGLKQSLFGSNYDD